MVGERDVVGAIVVDVVVRGVHLFTTGSRRTTAGGSVATTAAGSTSRGKFESAGGRDVRPTPSVDANAIGVSVMSGSVSSRATSTSSAAVAKGPKDASTPMNPAALAVPTVARTMRSPVGRRCTDAPSLRIETRLNSLVQRSASGPSFLTRPVMHSNRSSIASSSLLPSRS